MAITTKTFDAFGITYRTRQFSAVAGIDIIEKDGVKPPELLQKTEALVDGEWILLDNAEHINMCVIDMAGILPPMAVLRAICSIVNQFSFGFVEHWRGVRVPQRFMSDFKSVATSYSRPTISQIIQNGAATLRELEEYYSLEDAFKLFDIIVAKNVNEALANEAATKDK